MSPLVGSVCDALLFLYMLLGRWVRKLHISPVKSNLKKKSQKTNMKSITYEMKSSTHDTNSLHFDTKS